MTFKPSEQRKTGQEPPARSSTPEPPVLVPSLNALPTWELIFLALMDCVVLFVFVVIGRADHQMRSAQGPIIGALNTAVPFMIAWLVVGALVGIYAAKALYPLGRVIWKTLLAGVIAAPVGVVLREAIQAGPELRYFRIMPIFMLVATGVSVPMLLIWRVIWSRIRRVWWPELP
jgi:uncharacterized membrane protein YeaQ/YmgE (transglycosylase-associated protein family)